MFNVCIMVMMAAVEVVEGKGGKVRYVFYFKHKAKGTDKVVQFYKAIYPPDYSDLSMYTEEELQKMAAETTGPQDTPFFANQDDDDIYFGRSKECRATQLTDGDLARQCAWADLHLLGFQRATIYTFWNMYVYSRPFLMFLAKGLFIFLTLYVIMKVVRFLKRFMSSLEVNTEACLTMLNDAITNNVPGSGGENLYLNPDQTEAIHRLRLKMYHHYLSRKDESDVVDGEDDTDLSS